jgi:YbgC/YbaW family acyl-CoA thioester hydrolase
MSKTESLSYETTIRYNECDPTGFAFNANFFIWVQEAAGRYWQDLGIDVVSLGLARQTFMAVHLSCDYRRPVAYGDVIKIRPNVTKLNNSSVHIQYDVCKGDEVAAVARSIHVFMDTKEKKKLPLTDSLREKFEPAA